MPLSRMLEAIFHPTLQRFRRMASIQRRGQGLQGEPRGRRLRRGAMHDMGSEPGDF